MTKPIAVAVIAFILLATVALTFAMSPQWDGRPTTPDAVKDWEQRYDVTLREAKVLSSFSPLIAVVVFAGTAVCFQWRNVPRSVPLWLGILMMPTTILCVLVRLGSFQAVHPSGGSNGTLPAGIFEVLFSLIAFVAGLLHLIAIPRRPAWKGWAPVWGMVSGMIVFGILITFV